MTPAERIRRPTHDAAAGEVFHERQTMSRVEFIRITTADTKKTYELPGDDADLWEVRLSMASVEASGHVHFGSHEHVRTITHVERQTLVNAGLLPCVDTDATPEQTETAEDLVIRLLEHVGVFPVLRTEP